MTWSRWGQLVVLTVAVAAGTAANAANLITNGGFESNGGVGTSIFADWTAVDQVGSFSPGAWFVQTGTGSPINGFAVPAPPEGSFAAMTDQGGAGSHVLYQDIVVPVGVTSAILSFEYFLQNFAADYITPDTLDFTAEPNQQARVDLITTTADPFSVAGGDVLQNIYQTLPGDPLVAGYFPVSVNITSLLQGLEGQTIRLRFAEVDNQLFFNNGVDNVVLDVTVAAVPEPSTFILAALGGLGLVGLVWRKRRAG